MKPRVLVTGGSGFVGWNVVQALIQRGVSVSVTSRGSAEAFPAGVEVYRVDLMRAEEVAEMIASTRATHLIHLAWTARPGVFWETPENLNWVAASVELYRAFVAAGGKRIVMVGSCAEYDWTNRLLSESSTALLPQTLYGICKDALRRILEAAALRDGVRFAWGRLFWLYGPREVRGRLVSDLMAGLLGSSSIPCSLGTQLRDFLHVEDAAEALVQLMFSSVDGPVNIGAGAACSVANIINQCTTLLGQSHLIGWGALPSSPEIPAELTAEVERLRDRVGFRPKYTLASGLEQTAQWWRKNLEPTSPISSN